MHQFSSVQKHTKYRGKKAEKIKHKPMFQFKSINKTNYTNKHDILVNDDVLHPIILFVLLPICRYTEFPVCDAIKQKRHPRGGVFGPG